MTAPAAGLARRPQERSRPVSRLVPPQHGAWAFLALPVALALTVPPRSGLQVLAVLAWVSAYPAAWAVTGRLTAPRPERFDHALRLWPPLVVLAATPVLLSRPWLAWVGLTYGALFAVNLRFARDRRERALVNDLVLVLECTVLVPVLVGLGTAAQGWVPPFEVLDGPVVLRTVVCFVTLAGSVLHVKSLIRERADARYARAAKDVSVAGAAVVAALAVLGHQPAWPALVLLLVAGRCWWVPRDWRPARVGLVELAAFAAVAVSLAVAS